MNIELLVYILFCHIIGDYFLQSSALAYEKHYNTFKGWIAAFIHCMIYSIMTMIILHFFYADENTTVSQRFLIFGIVFVPHFIIDKTPIVYWFVVHFLGRGITRAAESSIIVVNTLVYVVIDNTLHIVCMYFMLNQLF